MAMLNKHMEKINYKINLYTEAVKLGSLEQAMNNKKIREEKKKVYDAAWLSTAKTNIFLLTIFIFSYIKNKIVKFYPLYFICCIVCAVCFEEFNAFYINLKSGFISLGLNLALLQSWTQNPYTFNSVSWFLSSLLGVYFVAPFALKLFKKVKSKYGYVLLFG